MTAQLTMTDMIRLPEKLLPDDKRVITRFLNLHSPRRIKAIFNRVMNLSDERVAQLLSQVEQDFASRHKNIEEDFLRNYREAAARCKPNFTISDERRLLIGAYFTMEYSIESAALFNPSMVPHPDQEGVPEGKIRFLMSLRATGEGHVSSIVFRQGMVNHEGGLAFDPPGKVAVTAKPVPDPVFEKRLFFRKLMEMGAFEELVIRILLALPERFTIQELRSAIREIRQRPGTPKAFRTVASDMLWLAHANYELRFPETCVPADMVIFPATDNESHGMEDLRLVRFVEEDGQPHYYGTYTAYNGQRSIPMMLDTADFRTFNVATLNGKYAKNKGLALFPRKVGGSYMMIARQDGENLYLLVSDNPHFWNAAMKLQQPAEPWEFIQIGNCGSPLETEAGWILLTHGVGPVRQYCIGATLLDREDPSRVIGRLREPLLTPGADEREGYVPNVVYSCGSLIHGDRMVIPYATSDSRTAFAITSVAELVQRLIDAGP